MSSANVADELDVTGVEPRLLASHDLQHVGDGDGWRVDVDSEPASGWRWCGPLPATLLEVGPLPLLGLPPLEVEVADRQVLGALVAVRLDRGGGTIPDVGEGEGHSAGPTAGAVAQVDVAEADAAGADRCAGVVEQAELEDRRAGRRHRAHRDG